MRWLIVIAITLLFSASALNTRVAVVGFQKNEVAQLDFWLAYHVALFGATNIAVLDNYSSDNASIVILHKWVKSGVHVLFEQGPYIKKGELTASGFSKLFPTHQIAIPLDIDEILVSYREGLPVIGKNVVHDDLDRFWENGAPCANLRQYFSNQLIKLNDTVQNSPYFNRWPIYGGLIAKKIVRSELLVSFDHGNHKVQMKPYRGQAATHRNCSTELNHLGLLHYVLSEPIIMLRKAILDCIGFGYFPANMTSENFRSFADVIEERRLCVEAGGCSIGKHKLVRVLHVYDHGVDSLFTKPANITYLHRVGNFTEILAKIST